MDNTDLLELVRLLEGAEFEPIQSRITDRLQTKAKLVIKGTDEDERNRGWIEALEWLSRLSSDIRREIQDASSDPDGEKNNEGADNV